MRLKSAFKILIVLGLCWVVQGRANEPVFLQWLAPDDPGDMTIRAYWDEYSADKLSPAEIVDLGTMLFSRGYPRDAERLYRDAIKRDKKLYEAWFRLGLVEHQQGNRSAARKAYHRCLKIFKGHGWCNFYLGLLEEQDHHAKEAMKYFKKAFRYAPVLGDEKINPELRNSDLAVGAWLEHSREQDFQDSLPMSWLAPEKMKKVRKTVSAEARKSAKLKAPPVVKLEEASPEKKVKKPATELRKIEKIKVEKPTSAPEAVIRKTPPKRRTITGGKKGVRSPAQRPTPRPTPRPPTTKPEGQKELPFGIPGDHGVSSDGYPGF